MLLLIVLFLAEQNMLSAAPYAKIWKKNTYTQVFLKKKHYLANKKNTLLS